MKETHPTIHNTRSTFFLMKNRSSFAKSFLGVLNINFSSVFYNFYLKEDDNIIDSTSIYRDWQSVGDDFRSAIVKYNGIEK